MSDSSFRRFIADTVNPRKRITPTTLTTQNQGTVQSSAVVGAEQGSARGGTFRDVVPQLGNFRQAALTYDEMANSDSAVDVSLRASKMPIMGADYFMEPASTQQIDLDISEFVGFNLLEGLSAPFLNSLEDILRMYEFGYSFLETVYELRQWNPQRTMANRKTYTMLKKLAPRPTPTISKIIYDDNGGPVSVVHNAVRSDNKPQEVTIPITNGVLFTFNRKGGNLEGKSLLRTAYRPWYFKSNMYNIDGIQKERHGIGFPVIHLPPGFKDKDVVAAKNMVRNIRTNEHGGAVLPPGWVLEFADIHGQPVDIIPSIEHHNGMIMLNTMSQFLLLGLEGSGGGRATSGSAQDMFNKSLRYVGNQICDMINMYVIPTLVAANFATDRFPKLKIRNIGETKDLQQWASGMANLKAQGLITYTAELETWVRKIIDAPLTPGTPDTATAPTDTAQKGNVTSQNGGNQGVAPDNAGG